MSMRADVRVQMLVVKFQQDAFQSIDAEIGVEHKRDINQPDYGVGVENGSIAGVLEQNFLDRAQAIDRHQLIDIAPTEISEIGREIVHLVGHQAVKNIVELAIDRGADHFHDAARFDQRRGVEQ